MRQSTQLSLSKSRPSNFNSEKSKFLPFISLTLYFESRLWHDIADPLVEYFKDKTFDKGENNRDLLTLYEAMVGSLTGKVNPIKYALITVAASRQFEDFEEAIEFLEKARVRFDGEPDA